MGSKGWKHTKATIGSILVDLGKLTFGSLILGSVLTGGFDPFQTFLFGIAITIILFITGAILVIKSKE